MSNGNGTIHASAPGKVIWLGGFAALERPSIGYITTVSARVHVRLKARKDDMIRISASNFGMAYNCTIDQDTGALPEPALTELRLIKLAAEVAIRYAKEAGVATNGLTIVTDSDAQFSFVPNPVTKKFEGKSGLGSSAAACVATIGAILSSYGLDPMENDITHKLAQTAHSLATGKVGSGFDIAAATFGSIVYTRYSPDILKGLTYDDFSNDQLVSTVNRNWDYLIEPVNLPDIFTTTLCRFDGGGTSTKEFVSKVLKLKETDSERYWKLIKGIDAEDRVAVASLKEIGAGTDIDYNTQTFREAFDTGRLLTKKLGELSGCSIESGDVTSLIEETKKNGAFVSKVPGSGGKDALAALSTDKESSERLRKFLLGVGSSRIIDVQMHADGLRIEHETNGNGFSSVVSATHAN